MADGNRYLARDWSYGEARLGWATAARSSLWARCGCGREAVVDPPVSYTHLTLPTIYSV